MCVGEGGHYHKNNFSKRWFHIYSLYFQWIINIEVYLRHLRTDYWIESVHLYIFVQGQSTSIFWPSNRHPIFSFSNWRQVYGHMQRSKRRDIWPDMLHYMEMSKTNEQHCKLGLKRFIHVIPTETSIVWERCKDSSRSICSQQNKTINLLKNI